jgi:hypothetical protein
MLTVQSIVRGPEPVVQKRSRLLHFSVPVKKNAGNLIRERVLKKTRQQEWAARVRVLFPNEPFPIGNRIGRLHRLARLAPIYIAEV